MHFHHFIDVCCLNSCLLMKDEKGDSIFRMDFHIKLAGNLNFQVRQK
jgi:hypothetical protein